MVQTLENIDKSKVYVDRIEGLDEVVSDVIGNTLTGAVSTITTSDLTAGKILVSDSNGKVAASNISSSSIPDDSNLVHKTGNETIAGTKTFSSTISGSINGNAATVTNGVYTTGNQTITGEKTFSSDPKTSGTWKVYRSDFTKGDTPSSAKYFGLFGLDAAPQDSSSTAWQDKRLAIVESCVTTSGETQVYLKAYKNATSANGGGNNFGITLHYPASDSGYANLDSSPATSDNSTKIATTAFVKNQGYLTSHQSLSNYVTLNGNQTISGTKTFTANQIISGASKILQIKNTNVTRNTAPSANVNTIVVNGLDSAGKNLWGLYNTWTTGKANEIQLLAYKGSTTDNTYTSIGVGYDTSGNPFTRAPTPATSDNSTKIATTAFVKNQGYLSDTNFEEVSVVIETYKNGSDWYRLYSDGWIEQGGRATSKTWTFPKPFSSDTSFSIVSNNHSSTNGYGRPDVLSVTATGATANSNAETPIQWIACGY